MKRMVAIVVAAAREVVGPSLGYILFALLGVVASERQSFRPEVSNRRWSIRIRMLRWP